MSDPNILAEYSASRHLYLKALEQIRPIFLECYAEDCQGKVSFKCKCSDENIFVCENHITSHLKEDSSEKHVLRSIKPDLNKQKSNKLVNYIRNYNSDLKLLKVNIISKISEHIRKIMEETDELLEHIKEMISENNQILSVLIDEKPKTFEDLTLLNQIIQSNFQSDLITQTHEYPISHECIDIIHAEISD